MTKVEERLRARIERFGPVPFAELMEIALYDADDGFYRSGGRAGRRGDFLTSPEVGPLFGAVVARALDAWWVAADRPPVFVVVEAGAGPGSLARAVLHADPACSGALRYVLVESSPEQRAHHATNLSLEDPSAAFATGPEPDDDEPSVAHPDGPIVVSLPELPRVPAPCVVLANELLDNLPVSIAQRGERGWAEVMVGSDGTAFTEVLVPLSDATARRLDAVAPDAPLGGRVPLPDAAQTWIREARSLAGQGGRVVAFDYGRAAAELAAVPWTEWLRTYRRHARGGSPFVDLGDQDITADVPLDLLDPAPTVVSSQADWLRQHGIDELVAEGKRTWEERSAVGDLAAVRARSRIGESEALLDPGGLGGFRVLEWLP